MYYWRFPLAFRRIVQNYDIGEAFFSNHYTINNILVGVELKIYDFKPEYAGKIKFYLSAVDEPVHGEFQIIAEIQHFG